MRLVVNAIRRKPAAAAVSILSTLNKKAARLVEKALKSALANAKVKGLKESHLVVSEIKADGGPVLKRFMARAMGRADEILKRTTHLTLVLREGEKPFVPPSPATSGEEKAKGEKTKLQKPKKQKVAEQGKTRKALAAA